jgi:hypothetical protein
MSAYIKGVSVQNAEENIWTKRYEEQETGCNCILRNFIIYGATLQEIEVW